MPEASAIADKKYTGGNEFSAVRYALLGELVPALSGLGRAMESARQTRSGLGSGTLELKKVRNLPANWTVSGRTPGNHQGSVFAERFGRLFAEFFVF